MTIYATPQSVESRFPAADIQQGSWIDQPGAEGTNTTRLQAVCDRANDWATGKVAGAIGAGVLSAVDTAFVTEICEYFVFVELTQPDKDSFAYQEWDWKRSQFEAFLKRLQEDSDRDGATDSQRVRVAFQIPPPIHCEQRTWGWR